MQVLLDRYTARERHRAGQSLHELLERVRHDQVCTMRIVALMNDDAIFSSSPCLFFARAVCDNHHHGVCDECRANLVRFRLRGLRGGQCMYCYCTE